MGLTSRVICQRLKSGSTHSGAVFVELQQATVVLASKTSMQRRGRLLSEADLREGVIGSFSESLGEL